MVKFLKSKKHRSLYLELALKYFVSPDHVRQLAHGKEYISAKEKEIHDILMSRGVLLRHHYAEDY